MSSKDIDFPQYRKLRNEKVFYRIVDNRHFDEIQLVGSKANFFQHTAEQYPEILRIQDMLQESPYFMDSTEREFEELLNNYALR